MIQNIAAVLLCLAATAGVFRCSTHMLTAGNSSSETTNGFVVGSLVKTDGSPAEYTIVKLLPDTYDPVKDGPMPDSLTDTTDERGTFQFHVSGEGMFTIVGVRPKTGERVLITGVEVGKTDTATVLRHTVQNPGSIKIILPAGVNTVNGYLYIPGTFIFAYLKNSQGAIVVDSVPAGVNVDVAFSATNSFQTTLLRDAIRVTSLDTAIVWNPGWPHARSIALNTAASGAGISGIVTGFPVLVRLTVDNFGFTQARNNGEDIRFTKRDNAFLPYEIERWDAIGKKAEVWVKVDTVYGNDSSQAITMYWGNSAATSASNGAAVFDTAAGFTAVWHLDTDCSDATAGNHGGTSFGATDTSGIIGDAKKFDGSSYIQVAGLLGVPPSITISAWVRLDSTSGSGQEIVSLGDAVAIRAYRTTPDGTAGFFCSKVSGSDTVHVFTNTGASILKTGWRYLVYTVDVARHVQSMYIDGTFQSSTNDSNPIDYGLGLNTVLGAHGNKKTQSYAFGCIDEARVCRVARSMDWIKLCYMNQKEQDALVNFR